MPEYPEDIDQLGPFYKRRFDELSDSPESEVKGSLFEKMDMLEGKRPKTVYLHFNVFGMKVAASITMLIVSSLALVAVAAVTILAVRNNKRLPKSPSEEIVPMETPTSEPSYLPENKKQLRLDTIATPQLPEEIPQTTEPQDQEKMGKEEQVPPSSPSTTPSKQELPTAPPADKNGDNSRLLKELEEDELFKEKK